MIVLDTNIVLELQRPQVSPAVSSWIASLDPSETFICGPVIMEQSYGAAAHRLRTGSGRYPRMFELLLAEFAGRVAGIDVEIFGKAGTMRAQREAEGRHLSVGDAMIAAICLSHGATLATRNVRDFEGLGLDLVNPFEHRA
jgi:predicted nucleic acid-binding protein